MFLLTQDAIVYFESKGADAKWALKLRDWDDKPLFDGGGLITDEGRGVLSAPRPPEPGGLLDVSRTGEVFGTRRPPAQKALSPRREFAIFKRYVTEDLYP